MLSWSKHDVVRVKISSEPFDKLRVTCRATSSE
jgi:hypothetical protein